MAALPARSGPPRGRDRRYLRTRHRGGDRDFPAARGSTLTGWWGRVPSPRRSSAASTSTSPIRSAALLEPSFHRGLRSCPSPRTRSVRRFSVSFRSSASLPARTRSASSGVGRREPRERRDPQLRGIEGALKNGRIRVHRLVQEQCRRSPTMPGEPRSTSTRHGIRAESCRRSGVRRARCVS